MATYTKKYCPHCGKMYQEYNTMTKHQTVSKGCPIISCRFCGEYFLDKDIKEPGFSETPPKSANIFTCFFAPLFPFGLASIPMTIGVFAIDDTFCKVLCAIFAILFFGAYVGLVCGLIKNLDELNQEILIDYEESRKRLEDEEYIILLLKLGYRVPKKFIAEHHPNLIGKKFK